MTGTVGAPGGWQFCLLYADQTKGYPIQRHFLDQQRVQKRLR
jgi:hypothetical protein